MVRFMNDFVGGIGPTARMPFDGQRPASGYGTRFGSYRVCVIFSTADVLSDCVIV